MEEIKKLTMNEFLERMKRKGYNAFKRVPCGCALCVPNQNGEIYEMTRETEATEAPTTPKDTRETILEDLKRTAEQIGDETTFQRITSNTILRAVDFILNENHEEIIKRAKELNKTLILAMDIKAVYAISNAQGKMCGFVNDIAKLRV